MESNLNIPIFELGDLRKGFWTYLVINVLVTIITYVLTDVFNYYFPIGLLAGRNNMILFSILVILSLIYSHLTKRELKNILAIANHADKHLAYVKFFKRRLLWNMFSILVTAGICITTGRRIFLYVLLLQTALSILSFPNKKLIARELDNPDIISNE